MGKRMAGYLLLAAASIYMFFVFDGQILSGVVVLELLYPLLSFFYLWRMRHSLKLQMGYVPDMGEKEKKIQATAVLENRFRAGSVRYRVRTYVSCRFFHQKIRQKAAGIAEAGERETIPFTFSSTYSGNLEFVLECLEIYDFLGIFYWKIPINERHSIGIMPSFDLMPLEISRATREFIADAEEFSAEKSGDDPSEVYQIREFRAQDRVQFIHWKRSAKEEKLMVKDQGFPLGCVVLIWMRVFQDETDGAGFSRMLEQAASLSATLMEEHCIHMAAWFEEKNRRVVKWRVGSGQAVYEWIWQFLSMEPCKNKELEAVYYEDAFRGEHFSSIVVIDGAGRLTVNGETPELLCL